MRSSIRFQGGFEEAGAACWSCSSSFFGVGPPGISWIRRKHSTENRSRFSYDPGDADAVLLSRQLIADEQWTKKVKEGAKCVAANYCWRSVIRGSRVQCAYNPVVGRETIWGANSMTKAYAPKRVFVIGAGPAGLEYARIASATGHAVAVYEREEAVGGYIRAYGALPYRQQVVSRRRIIGLEKNIADLKSKLKKKTSERTAEIEN